MLPSDGQQMADGCGDSRLGYTWDMAGMVWGARGVGGRSRWRRFHGGETGSRQEMGGPDRAASGECRAGPASVWDT